VDKELDMEGTLAAGAGLALVERLGQRSAHTAVIGLGYVGLPLAVELGSAGFSVTSIDVNPAKVDAITRGTSYIDDVPAERVAKLVSRGTMRATTDFSALKNVDTINICVPTPLRKTKDPDMSFVVSAVEQIAKYLKHGQLVILESTTYPGTTEEILQPMLEAGGLRAGHDFFLAFSPERVDPGNDRWHTGNIPKVVGGINAASTEVAATLYRQITDTVVPVSSARVAEMVKLLENTFRAVNIGMVNELALMCRDLHVNVWEVIEAASTKPFGFMPFYPGPGLGGHCIPIDPFYLSWKARQTGFESRFIELAGHINAGMPRYVVELTAEALNSVSKPLRGARVHVFGIAYKPDVDDVRESPALDVVRLLQQRGALVSYSDPHVPQVDDHGVVLEAVSGDEAFRRGFDCAVITTNHRAFDYGRIAAEAPLVVDTRNALKGHTGSNIFRL
jgi:UDP-N-acetyl-D-glucosamine dehydrogenase